MCVGVWGARLARLVWLALVATRADEEVCAADDGQCREVGRESRLSSSASGGAYFWPRRAGNDRSSAYTPHVGPTNLSVGPSWQWDNEDDEEMRNGAQIDDQGNIYLVTAQGWARKFSPDGKLLWKWRTKEHVGKVHSGPTLYRGNLHFVSTGSTYNSTEKRLVGGFAFSLSMQTGEIVWRVKLPGDLVQFDSPTTTVGEGVVLLALRAWEEQPLFDGNNKVVALKAADGDFLWDYKFDGVVWNFMAALPGDGSALFATNCGVAHRLGLQSGSVLWKANLEEPGTWCSTGGGSLNPEGTKFYIAANYYGRPFGDMANCITDDCPEGPGLSLVYNVSDGALLFRSRHPNFMMQYPAVGPIHANSSQQQVVTALGMNPALLPEIFLLFHQWMPRFMHEWWLPNYLFFQAQHHFSWVRRLLGIPVREHNIMAAYDEDTKALLWEFQEEPWDHFAALGDAEGFYRRVELNKQDWRREVICGPDNWGIPVIAGDGTVYAGSGLNGNLYAIKDANGDGKIDAAEVSTFHADYAFLQGPSLGPGMLVVAPCFGPMYVFRDQQQN